MSDLIYTKADRDITCYIVLFEEEDHYTTIYMDTVIDKHICLNQGILEAEGEETEFKILAVEFPEKGFIHTYGSFLKALELAVLLSKGNTRVFKCVIRKGTMWREYIDNHTYASRSIQFISEIDINPNTLLSMLPKILYRSNTEPVKYSIFLFKNGTSHKLYVEKYTIYENVSIKYKVMYEGIDSSEGFYYNEEKLLVSIYALLHKLVYNTEYNIYEHLQYK